MAEVAAGAVVDDPRVAELVARAQAGDERAWAAIVGLYIKDIWRLSVYLLHGDVVAAEDLAQRTWERAQKGLAAFRCDVPVRTWIRAICRNCYVDEWRRRRRADQVFGESLDNEDAIGESPTGMIAEWEEQRVVALDLHRALAVLDEEEREAFRLVKGAGYTSLEVAQMLAVPASTIRSRVARAREKLAATLGDYQCKAS